MDVEDRVSRYLHAHMFIVLMVTWLTAVSVRFTGSSAPPRDRLSCAAQRAFDVRFASETHGKYTNTTEITQNCPDTLIRLQRTGACPALLALPVPRRPYHSGRT